MALDHGQPFNDAIATSLKLTVNQTAQKQPAGKQRVGIANDGFWGIPVRPDTRYHASLYAKADGGFTGPLTVAITSPDGATVHASAPIAHVTGSWKKYEVNLTTGKAVASADNRPVISAGSPGTVWFGMVSLFPPAFNNRPNGFRKDIMQLLAGMKPTFLRFPGGNYLEGNTIETRFDWKKTIGDIAQRPGHMNATGRPTAWACWNS
jgi:alpha-N-arabinofuranosidase